MSLDTVDGNIVSSDEATVTYSQKRINKARTK